jgi:DNA-binding transcriptional regulator YhcF (GntR family)
MLLKIDLESDVPIYIQLKSQIIEGIANGELKPGEPLPSVRQLAADLGINMHTVNKAYNILRQEGFLLVHRKKGVVINQPDGIKITEAYLNQLEMDLRPIIAEAFARGMPNSDFIRLVTAVFAQISEKGGKGLSQKEIQR